MNVRLPYSKHARYLTGIDWIIGALDHMSRRTTGGSNASQIVLELRGPMDDAHFRAAVTGFVQQFPVLGGYATRHWNVAPYWRMPRAAAAVPVLVETGPVAEAEVMAALARWVNVGFGRKRHHLALHLFHVAADRHYLAMRFDHRVFDAQGAEAFLELFQRGYEGADNRERLARVALTEPAHLCHWQRKFDAGRQLVRLLRALTGTTLATCPLPQPLRGRAFRFHAIRFDAQASQAILDRAYREAGYLLFMPYALTAAVQALHAAFLTKGVTGQDYVVSVSVDLRTPDTAAAKLFFNHVSFFLFRIPAAAAGDRRQVLEAVRTQMYEQVKNGFPRALAESSMLMRIVPLPVLSRLLLWPLHGEFASFGFASVGKAAYASPRFMDAEVVNLFHMPLVPVPPGLGFVVNQFGNRINAVLSYVDGLLTDDEVQRVADEVKRLL